MLFSANLIIDRLIEAEYFLLKASNSQGREFQFNMHAFLSAARNVTFSIQYLLSDTPQFSEWYLLQQNAMRNDKEMKFFVELRNITTKQGPVNYISGSLPCGGWTHRFVGKSVPSSISHEDIKVSGYRHIGKLADLLVKLVEKFPYHTDPDFAFTTKGMSVLNMLPEDFLEVLGFPRDWLSFSEVTHEEILVELKRQFDPLNRTELDGIKARAQHHGAPQMLSELSIVDQINQRLSDGDGALVKNIFLETIADRISSIDKDREDR